MEIGFIGLGTMGGNMAANILDQSEHSLTVYDLDTDAITHLTTMGASRADNPKQVAEITDILFLSLPNPDAVNAVVFGEAGVLEGIGSGDILVDLTTSKPELTQEICTELSQKGAEMLDAGVTRGIEGAIAGEVALMVGGKSPVFDKARPVMETFAESIRHVGEEPGMGHAAKLLTNYIWSTSLVAACEAVLLGEKYGLDAEKLIEVFNDGAGRNVVTEETFVDHIISREYATEFSMALWDKDLRLFSEFAEKNDANLMLGAVVRQMAGQAESVLGPDVDSMRMYEFIRMTIAGDDATFTSSQ